jgi:hypothetical protein
MSKEKDLWSHPSMTEGARASRAKPAVVSDAYAKEEAARRAIPVAEVKLALTTEHARNLRLPRESLNFDDHGNRSPGARYSTSTPRYNFVRTIDGGY